MANPWHEQLTFDNLKARQGELRDSVAGNKALWILGFAGAYIVMAAAQLPGAALMTIAGGRSRPLSVPAADGGG